KSTLDSSISARPSGDFSPENDPPFRNASKAIMFDGPNAPGTLAEADCNLAACIINEEGVPNTQCAADEACNKLLLVTSKLLNTRDIRLVLVDFLSGDFSEKWCSFQESTNS